MDAEACEALTGDVFKVLERARQRRRTWDYVVVDPPPFSRVRAGSTFSARRDWRDLAHAVAQVCAPDARVLAVSNAVGLGEGEFLEALDAGILAAGRRARIRWRGGLPPDFPALPAFAEGRSLDIAELVV
jgi:23S rRNA (cytosine1962-C5)-methyltransferase